MSAMTATRFCHVVEERLGWEIPPGGPSRAVMIEARKVNYRIAANPTLYTWPNLLLAVELLTQEKASCGPCGVFSHVERALERARVPESDIEVAIDEAVRIETRRGDPDGWAVRFARATGYFRLYALQEWTATR